MALTELERTCIAEFRSLADAPAHDQLDAWTSITLRLLLEAARVTRPARLRLDRDAALKSDGSPTVEVEIEVEARLRALVERFAPDAAFVGEESGGTLPGEGYAVAVDPIDGTWAFVNDTETFATSVAVFRDGQVVVGAVCNPATAEIAYSAAGSARLLQLAAFGEVDDGADLPVIHSGSRLVNVHPGRATGPVLQALHDAWHGGDLDMVRSPGGSPAWALVEAAKGTFVYVNLWSKRPAEPFDLAGPAFIVRSAGGDVLDIDGNPIDALSHAGPLVAAVDVESARRVCDLIRPALAP